MDITAIYSPDLERNLDTARPLANHLKIEITLAPRFSESTIDKIVTDLLTKHRGETVLLVGNGSGNLRALHPLPIWGYVHIHNSGSRAG
jgi:hypothetical protein